MKMHHLDKEKVEEIMLKVKQVVDSGQYPADVIEEIFKLSQVDGEKFLECKNHPIQKEKVNFEIDPAFRNFELISNQFLQLFMRMNC